MSLINGFVAACRLKVAPVMLRSDHQLCTLWRVGEDGRASDMEVGVEVEVEVETCAQYTAHVDPGNRTMF